ncbi:MAG TPA: hypothetical protein VN607_12055 [Gemmatimonadaceae bacterium]|nr:hypothetical protein [Gemmatimonadaceae bacterium]
MSTKPVTGPRSPPAGPCRAGVPVMRSVPPAGDASAVRAHGSSPIVRPPIGSRLTE